MLSNTNQVWTTPYESDWAIALGSIAVKLAGDFDLDGDVDSLDFLKWQRGFGDIYDSDDLADWEDYYGTPAPPLSAGVANVAEPSGLLLGVLASVGLQVVRVRN